MNSSFLSCVSHDELNDRRPESDKISRAEQASDSRRRNDSSTDDGRTVRCVTHLVASGLVLLGSAELYRFLSGLDELWLVVFALIGVSSDPVECHEMILVCEYGRLLIGLVSEQSSVGWDSANGLPASGLCGMMGDK